MQDDNGGVTEDGRGFTMSTRTLSSLPLLLNEEVKVTPRENLVIWKKGFLWFDIEIPLVLMVHS